MILVILKCKRPLNIFFNVIIEIKVTIVIKDLNI